MHPGKDMSVIKKDNKFSMSDSVHVSKSVKPDSETVAEHKHDFFEIAYMLKGKCVHFIDGREYPVRRGDLVVINYNQTHSIRVDAGTEFMNILLKPEYISKNLVNHENAFALQHLSEFEDFGKILDEGKRKVTFSGEDRNRIEAVIDTLSRELHHKLPGYELAVRSQFNLLLIMIFRKMSLKFDEGFGAVSDKLFSFITAHCHEKLTLSSIAKMCAYNTAYFSRIFKEYTGMTFTSYLKSARIEKAAELLSSTDLKITDIIYESGYSDRTKFFSHFKSLKGMSPLQYRKSKK